MEDFCFGLFTDIQYADRPIRIGRYYRNALRKTQRCIDAFNQIPVDFCVHLGDLIDWPGEPDKGREALNNIMPIMNSFNGPMYYVLGNHDVDSVPSAELASIFGIADGKTWYSFDHKGVHFVVLDCNFDAQGVAFQPGTTEWDCCYLPDSELNWLKSDLKAAVPDVAVVMVHALLDDIDNAHAIKNAAEARRILENCGKRTVVFQGHMHSGHESVKNGIGYHTLRSIVNGRTRTCFWAVEVNQNGIDALVYDSVVNKCNPTRKNLLKL